MGEQHVVGALMGASRVSAALFDGRLTLVQRVELPATEAGPDALIDELTDLIRALSVRPDAVGVGAEGPVRDGVVITAPNLAGWLEPVPLGRLLDERLRMPVTVANESDGFTVGEWVMGAGRGSANMLAIRLDVGIGGGFILCGKPFFGDFGIAGEIGHMCVRPHGALCSCGRRGCLESYAGAASMEMKVEVALADGRETMLETTRRETGCDRLTPEIWAEALRRGDPLAREMIDDAIGAVGAAVGAVVTVLDVNRVVVGGGMAEHLGEIVVEGISAECRDHLYVIDANPQILLSELGPDAVNVGAAHLATELISPKQPEAN